MSSLEQMLMKMQEACSMVSCEVPNTVSCDKCNDTGWIFFDDEQGYHMQKECPCGYLKHERLNRRLRFANIPEQFRGIRLDDFDCDRYTTPAHCKQAKIVLTACKLWLEKFEEMYKAGKGFYFCSSTKGSGKTMLAIALANELIYNKGIAVKFATSMQILNEIKNSWNQNSEYTENKLLDALATADVLIIDDFGTEQVRDWMSEKFYSIINSRYVDRKITIFTSNVKPADLKYDDRIINRLAEKCFIMPFPEESIRIQLASKDNADFRDELLRRLE